MSATHPSKRRRLDDALSKPFKSPLKTVLQAKTGNASITATPPTPQSPNTHIEKHKLQHTTLPTTTTKTSASTPPPPQAPPSSPPPISTSIPPGTTPTAHLHTLQTNHTSLLNHLSHLRTNIETSTQALKILGAPEREAELTRLIQKWKIASRAAAEGVFAGARDKVNRMGGVQGLKERERVKREEGARDGLMGGGSWGWGGADENGGGGGGGGRSRVGDDEVGDGGGGDEERDNAAVEEGVGDREERLEREGRGAACLGEESEYDREVRRELEREEEEVEKDDIDEEGGYTMDMMLKTMNIDLRVIGYDKALQKWVD